MFTKFNSVTSVFSLIYTSIINIYSYFYFLPLLLLFSTFLIYRFPYLYSPYIFFALLVMVLFGMFISMFLFRLFTKPKEFFSSLLPAGTPMYIGPLVVMAETISYVIRPVVLIFRPYINIRLGCFGAMAMGKFCVVNKL